MFKKRPLGGLNDSKVNVYGARNFVSGMSNFGDLVWPMNWSMFCFCTMFACS